MHSQSQETQRYDHHQKNMILQSEKCKHPQKGTGEDNPGWAICRGLMCPIDVVVNFVANFVATNGCWQRCQRIQMVDHTNAGISDVGIQICRSDDRNKYIQKTEYHGRGKNKTV